MDSSPSSRVGRGSQIDADLMLIPMIFRQPWRLGTFLVLGLPGLGASHMDDRFTCDPAGFHLARTAVTTADSTVAYQYRLTGTLEVPTPGYQHMLLRGIQRSETDSVVHQLRLVLTPPGGMTMQVISDLAIDVGFRLSHGNAERVLVSIEKTFNWGPSHILCVVPFE